MINVKLIVFFYCFVFVASSVNYCEICRNHTLCKYIMPGPSPTCKHYDGSPITKDDVNNIINKINERRNFVASGLSGLPQAANMNKIYWSEELATLAQRWVDQCDPFTRPDREDESRDLEDTKVGQAIASVALPAPGMQLKSLIDVLFMQSLDFKGTVTYYNQTRDWKTNYFTQLIWGETDRIGCGRARFYVEQKRSMIERLVCNFAPKGNIHGKPVYAVGYPATQCQQNKMADRKFESLCQCFVEDRVSKSTIAQPTVTSLLRILNLSNKPEANTHRNNLKQVKFDVNDTSEQRNQKIRHVLFNNSYALLKNMPPSPVQGHWNSQPNYTRNQRLQHYQQERGHSRVYHGHDVHDHSFEPDYRETASHNYHNNDNPINDNYPSNPNYRKLIDYTTEPFSPQPTDFRKYNRYNQCTRKGEPRKSDCQPGHQTCDECTRKQIRNCIHTTPSCQSSNPCVEKQCDICPCNTPRPTCATLPPQCPCNANCKCFSIGCDSNTPCPPFRRSNKNNKDETKKSGDLHYYDLSPNIGIRSGEHDNESSKSTDLLSFTPRDASIQEDTTDDNFYRRFPPKIKHIQKQVKDIFENKRNNKQDYDYIYDSSYSRERKRRDTADEMTFKPFWQMDEFNRDKSTLLKSIRYTTLNNKKVKKTRRTNPTTVIKTSQTTESITLQLKDGSKGKQNQKNVVTEKYLSFDELMHLRKFTNVEAGVGVSRDTNDNTRRDLNVNARRADTASTKASSTSEYTANTPFARKKHCTRKLTCTWTAPTVTDADGSVITGDRDRGSRTPPGYVEGCTRTSTCTRDFMDRNKFATITEETGSGETTIEDEDYCEKRALDVRKRDSVDVVEDGNVRNFQIQSFTNTPYYIIYSYNEKETGHVSSTTPALSTENCVCDEENLRIKRQGKKTYDSHKTLRHSQDSLSYGDLYYLVLQKIIERWKNTQNTNSIGCYCNTALLARASISIVLFMYLCNSIINLFM